MVFRALGAAALVAVSAGCAPAGGARPVATSTVSLPRSYLYAPAAITVPAGTRVTWTNADVFTHSVRLRDDGDTTMIMTPGQTASFTFTRPGLHHYDCSFHTQMMKGTVEVTGK
jgi:plastocyanin